MKRISLIVFSSVCFLVVIQPKLFAEAEDRPVPAAQPSPEPCPHERDGVCVDQEDAKTIKPKTRGIHRSGGPHGSGGGPDDTPSMARQPTQETVDSVD